MYVLADFLARLWVRFLLRLGELMGAFCDPPDAPPIMPTAIDHEYFALLEEEGRS